MSDAEMRLVTKIIETGDLTGAIRAGISSEMFADPLAKDMFDTILFYHQEREHFGRVPSRRWMQERFEGTFRSMELPETLPELCVELRDKVMQHAVWEVCEEIVELNETDPREALARLRTEVLRLGRMTPKNTDRILAEDAEEIIARAEIRRNSETILGIPFPWEELNQVTQGIHSEDFIVLFGRPKSMKSWLAAKIVAHAYLYGNRRILIYSCEMSTALFEDRLACALHELSYSQLKDGSLNEAEWRWYQAAIRALAADEKKDAVNGRHRSIKFSSHLDDPRGGGVSHLMAKIEEFDPDLVLVDSFYKMKDDRTGKRSVNWEAQYGITQDLKGVTQIMHIPVIAVTQRHRSKKEETDDEKDLGDVAYADAVGQEAEAVYRVKKEQTLPDGSTQLRVVMAGSRETAVGGFILHAIPATKFDLYGWLDENGKLTTSPLGAKPPRDLIARSANRPEKRSNGSNGTNVGQRVQVPSQSDVRDSLPRRA